MISRRTLLAGLALIASIRWLTPAQAAFAESELSLFTEGTFAVVQIDLARLDAPSLGKRLFDSPTGDAIDPPLSRILVDRVNALKAAGTNELVVLYAITDFPGPPVLAVLVGPGVDPKPIERLLIQGLPGLVIEGALAAEIRGFVVVGRPQAVAKIRESHPLARPDLTAALAGGPADASIRVAISPGKTFRRAIEETFAELPAALGGGPVATVTRGMKWMSLVFPTDPSRSRITIQADDAAAAGRLLKIINTSVKSLASGLPEDPVNRSLAARLAAIQASTEGDRVVAPLDPETFILMVAGQVRQVREAIAHTESVNNLKQIALAMHNYHSKYDTFPPAYRTDSNHQPLLSWRVLILPFVEEQNLFDEFHLNEPWDSPHNRALIPRMPKMFASPFESSALIKAGKTVYLTPRGNSTMFPGAQAIRIGDVPDGTSNTIMTVEVDGANATIWTKPDDWDVSRGVPELNRPFMACIGDGSVRTFRKELEPGVWQALTTRNAKDMIRWDDL